jgi:hypothetical protein
VVVLQNKKIDLDNLAVIKVIAAALNEYIVIEEGSVHNFGYLSLINLGQSFFFHN